MELRFLFLVFFTGMAYGSRMFSVPLILTWHTAMYDCAEQGTEAGCLDGGQNFCIWKNNTCYFHDYLSINCSDFHNSSKLCVSQENELCFYRFTTDRCLHHSGFNSKETGIFAAASVSGGMVSFLVEKLIGDDVSGMIITAIIELISSVVFTIAVETNEYSLWILTQILGSVVTFYCVSVAPDILRRTGRLTQKGCGNLLRILGVSIGISAFIYAMLFYFMTPHPFYKENPKFRQSLHLYGLGFYLTAVGVLMIAFIMKYPQWLDDNCPNNCCWLSSLEEEEEEEEEIQLGGNDNSSEVCSSPSPPIEGKLGDQESAQAQVVVTSSSPSTTNPLTFPKRTRTTSSSIHSTTSSNRSQKKRLKKEKEIRKFSQMFPQPIPELTPHLALLYQHDDASDKEDVDEDNNDENSSQEGGDEMKENDNNNNDNINTTFDDTIPTVMSPLDLPSPSIPFTNNDTDNNNDDVDENDEQQQQESATTTKLQKTEISPNGNASSSNDASRYKQSPTSPRSDTKSVTIVASPVEIIDTCKWPNELRLALGDLRDFTCVARYFDESGGGEYRAARSGDIEKDLGARLASVIALHMLSPLLFSPWSLSLPPSGAAASLGRNSENIINDDSQTPVKYYRDDERTRLKKRLRLFYEQHAPAHVSNIDKTVATFTLTENSMFQKLYAKYAADAGEEKKVALQADCLPDWMNPNARKSISFSLLSAANAGALIENSCNNNDNDNNSGGDESLLTENKKQQQQQDEVDDGENKSSNKNSNDNNNNDDNETSAPSNLNSTNTSVTPSPVPTAQSSPQPLHHQSQQQQNENENNNNDNKNDNNNEKSQKQEETSSSSPEKPTQLSLSQLDVVAASGTNNAGAANTSGSSQDLESQAANTITPTDTVQAAIDSEGASPEKNNSNTMNARSRENTILNNTAVPNISVTSGSNSPSSSTTKATTTGGITTSNSLSPAPPGTQQATTEENVGDRPTPEQMMKRRRRLAIFVKILQKAANNSTFDVPPVSSSSSPQLQLPLASTDACFLCHFNDSLKNEFGVELRKALRSIPRHWDDFVCSEDSDDETSSSSSSSSSSSTSNNSSRHNSDNDNDDETNTRNNNNGNVNSKAPSPVPNISSSSSGNDNNNKLGMKKLKLTRSHSFKATTTFANSNASPQRKSKVEKRLRNLVVDDLCQAITSVQGILPQFPFFEERYRNKLELWNLPQFIPALPQTELDALSPFAEDLAEVVGISSHGDNTSNNSSSNSAPIATTTTTRAKLSSISAENNIAGSSNPNSAASLESAGGGGSDNKNNSFTNISALTTSTSTTTPLEEGRRSLSTGLATSHHYFLHAEHDVAALGNRPLHAELLQVIRFHPPHVFVIHGELLVRLENKIKGDGMFASQSGTSSSNASTSVVVSLTDCERAIEAHFAARCELVATRRNKKTGVAIIFLTPPQTQGKWGSHWFSKHCVKTLPSNLIESIGNYIVIKPTFMARTKAWRGTGVSEEHEKIDAVTSMVDNLEEAQGLIFTNKQTSMMIGGSSPANSLNYSSTMPNFTGSPSSSMLSPMSPGGFSNASATSTSASPATASPQSPSGPTVWLTLPPSLMPEQERTNDSAAAVVRLYRGSLTLLETLRSVSREVFSSYLLDRSGMGSQSPTAPAPSSSAVAGSGGNPQMTSTTTTNISTSSAQNKNETSNKESSSSGKSDNNKEANLHKDPNTNNSNAAAGNTTTSSSSSGNQQQQVRPDMKSVSEMAKKLREQWACTAARCSVHLEYFSDTTPTAAQALGQLLFDIVLDRFFTSPFGCFNKDTLQQMAELYFCVDGKKNPSFSSTAEKEKEKNKNKNENELTANNNTTSTNDVVADSSTTTPSATKEQVSENEKVEKEEQNKENTTSKTKSFETPKQVSAAAGGGVDQIPASAVVFRSIPTLPNNSSGSNNKNQPPSSSSISSSSPLNSSGIGISGTSCGTSSSSAADAISLFAAPGGVQRVMKYVKEVMLVSPYRVKHTHGSHHAHRRPSHPTTAPTSVSVSAAAASASSSSTTTSAAPSQSPQRIPVPSSLPPNFSSTTTSSSTSNPSPFNSMQSCVILALVQAILPHSSSVASSPLTAQATATAAAADSISLIHNVLFSPRDAMEKIIREIIHPLLISVFPRDDAPNSLIPEAHGETLRMATESFTRCISTAVARSTVAVAKHGPAGDWLELALACALPRIAVDRRKQGSATTTGQQPQISNLGASP